MPRVFDNIQKFLSPALTETLDLFSRADFCVGYFNLRGWKQLHDHIDHWQGSDANECCRLLVGMQRLPQDTLREAFSLTEEDDDIDNQTAARLRRHPPPSRRLLATFDLPEDQMVIYLRQDRDAEE